jgi:hypothetical protein
LEIDQLAVCGFQRMFEFGDFFTVLGAAWVSESAAGAIQMLIVRVVVLRLGREAGDGGR